MADDTNPPPINSVAETTENTTAAADDKPRAQRRRKAEAEPAKVQKTATTRSRRYSEQERREKLAEIEAQVAASKSSLKEAIKSADISEQTYYQWKRSLKVVERSANPPAPIGDEFAELAQLEEENLRLRKVLAEKLRTENAELRKRLGMG